MRPAFDALFAIDDAMADVVAQSTQPALGAIKLAWWRERLQELDEGKVPAEPRLQAAAAELLPRGITGDELAALEDGYVALLREPAETELALQRGAVLFRIAAKLLGSDVASDDAGRLYAAGQLHRRRLLAPGTPSATRMRIPARLRPVTALAVLARRDLSRDDDEEEGTPGRAFALLRHRLTGRIG